MGVLILEGNPPVEVLLRRSARARRLSLRISRLDGRATLTLPNRVPDREGMAFVREREDWLRKHISAIEPEVRVALGGTVLFEGAELPLIAGDVKRAKLVDGALVLPDDPAMVGKRVAAFMKLRARDALADASDRYAAALGRSYNRISLRDTRSRWGSCSSNGDLMYSWRLIMAPRDVLDYVAAHEVAHLQHMDHSDRFWGVVDQLFPNHKACRAWLRTQGGTLHRVRFD
ncbi:M48 family metallopeptidase [Octadecabacter sp. G9-8]|uniref:M48 family metallopeptidase n=1 Tax=Octadecabacter dasysiphoniae TaxID=2909341 RepID=A0ABS9CQR1_9RHOB|nr:SprT family zinc-dependent metalloprotease [Octadecabacter dasysiphoniae]MCF2869573.1 M48 family metallopeptidase [Octadecabacter dasysiphoniae]